MAEKSVGMNAGVLKVSNKMLKLEGKPLGEVILICTLLVRESCSMTQRGDRDPVVELQAIESVISKAKETAGSNIK